MVFYQAVKKFHRTVILGVEGGIINVVDGSGHKLFMLMGFFEQKFKIIMDAARCVKGQKQNILAAVKQILAKEHGMVNFRPGTLEVMGRKTFQAPAGIEICHAKVEMGRIKGL